MMRRLSRGAQRRIFRSRRRHKGWNVNGAFGGVEGYLGAMGKRIGMID